MFLEAVGLVASVLSIAMFILWCLGITDVQLLRSITRRWLYETPSAELSGTLSSPSNEFNAIDVDEHISYFVAEHVIVRFSKQNSAFVHFLVFLFAFGPVLIAAAILWVSVVASGPPLARYTAMVLVVLCMIWAGYNVLLTVTPLSASTFAAPIEVLLIGDKMTVISPTAVFRDNSDRVTLDRRKVYFTYGCVPDGLGIRMLDTYIISLRKNGDLVSNMIMFPRWLAQWLELPSVRSMSGKLNMLVRKNASDTQKL
jgi:hypothetical protein